MRQIALESLAELGPEAASTFPAIDNLLRRDPSSQVRVTAAHVLAQLDPSGKLSVPLLAAMLGDPDYGLRRALLRDLDSFGPKGEAATHGLTEVIEQDDDDSEYDRSVRQKAVQTLSRVSPASISVPILLKALRREQSRKDRGVAGSILQTVGQIGPGAAPAIPMLVEAYNTSPNEHERGSAMIALGGIGLSARVALPTILKATKDPQWFPRGLALEALIKLQVEPDVVIPPLISALQDKQGPFRESRRRVWGSLVRRRNRRYLLSRRWSPIARFRHALRLPPL